MVGITLELFDSFLYIYFGFIFHLVAVFERSRNERISVRFSIWGPPSFTTNLGPVGASWIALARAAKQLMTGVADTIQGYDSSNHVAGLCGIAEVIMRQPAVITLTGFNLTE